MFLLCINTKHIMMHRKEPAKELGHIILFKDTVSANDVDKNVSGIVRRFKVQAKRQFGLITKGFAVNIPDAVFDAIKSLPMVESIEEDLEVMAFAGGKVTPTSTEIVPWGVKRIGTIENLAQSAATADLSGVHVFVLDTGVNKHTDLNIVENLSFVPGETAADGNGHGTAVAGVIAAKKNQAGLMGVCPGASIHNYKVLANTGSGSFSNILAAIDAVIRWKTANVTQKRVVVNMSLGAFVGSTAYNVLDEAVRKLTSIHGITVVVAAGNESNDASYYSPAHAAEAITVGSFDEQDKYSYFTNYGGAIDILAPGSNILTTYYLRSKTVIMNGTSFSCPHVAGAVGLLLMKNPDQTPAQILEEIVYKAGLSATKNPLITPQKLGTTNLSVYVNDTTNV